MVMIETSLGDVHRVWPEFGSGSPQQWCDAILGQEGRRARGRGALAVPGVGAPKHGYQGHLLRLCGEGYVDPTGRGRWRRGCETPMALRGKN